MKCGSIIQYTRKAQAGESSVGRRPSRILTRIQDAVIDGEYDLTRHAVDEMAEDDLGILDIENAILSGEIAKTETDDVRGPRYTIVGVAEDRKTEVGVVGRFTKLFGPEAPAFRRGEEGHLSCTDSTGPPPSCKH
jgi:hypothetical protein